jgi:drug/metabolite transporter (DMT)-like permease
MAATRFLVAGLILYAIARVQPDFERPKAVHWRTSFIVGVLLLLGGNGGVVFAEKYIPSSLAALLVAIEPFWVVILSWLWLKSARPNLKVVAGLILGLLGVWFLISGQPSPEGTSYAGSMQFWASLAVIGATFCWAAGSLFGLRAPVPKSSILSAGMQMMAGGAVLAVVSLLAGEWSQVDISGISTRSLFGLAYLIVFGSILAFTAYSWLLKNAKPATVATYAYVNPLIAVIIGWLIAGESMTGQMLIGAGTVVGSVVLITSQNKSAGSDNEVESPESESPAGSAKPLSASA